MLGGHPIIHSDYFTLFSKTTYHKNGKRAEIKKATEGRARSPVVNFFENFKNALL